MFEFGSFGKLLMLLGALLLIVGALFHFGGKLISLGHLPGDFHFQNDRFSFHFPVMTSIIISIVLTIFAQYFLESLKLEEDGCENIISECCYLFILAFVRPCRPLFRHGPGP